MKEIRGFNGPNHFLSNMYVVTGGIKLRYQVVREDYHMPLVGHDLASGKFAYLEATAQSSEHVYQALRFSRMRYVSAILEAKTPYLARMTAHKFIDAGVHAKSSTAAIPCMRDAIAAKFTQNQDLRTQLAETYDSPLFEENKHGDMFWGTVNGIGHNNLGQILMEERAKINCHRKLFFVRTVHDHPWCGHTQIIVAYSQKHILTLFPKIVIESCVCIGQAEDNLACGTVF